MLELGWNVFISAVLVALSLRLSPLSSSLYMYYVRVATISYYGTRRIIPYTYLLPLLARDRSLLTSI